MTYKYGTKLDAKNASEMRQMDRLDLNELLGLLSLIETEYLMPESMRKTARKLREQVGLCWGDAAPFRMVFMPTNHFEEYTSGHSPNMENENAVNSNKDSSTD